MGQQQLLLLVLGIVIVGLAVVVGIQAFSENQKKANADALVMTSMRIASDAQAWLRKPAAFGGAVGADGQRPDHFASTGVPALTLAMLGYPENSGVYNDVNGVYTVSIVGTGVFQIRATSASSSGDNADNNVICVNVAGSATTDISTTINPSGGTCPTS